MVIPQQYLTNTQQRNKCKRMCDNKLGRKLMNMTKKRFEQTVGSLESYEGIRP